MAGTGTGDHHEIVWEEPPADRPSRARLGWHAVLDQVRSRPGEWARVADYAGPASAYKVAQRLRRGEGVPTGRWEFLPRRNKEGGSLLYARFLGPDGDDAMETWSSDPDAAAAVGRCSRRIVAARTRADVVTAVADLVVELGGRVRPPADDGEQIDGDIGLGVGEPAQATADQGTIARLRLETVLPSLVADAGRLAGLLPA